MKKLIILWVLHLFVCATAIYADTFRVNYTTHEGLGKRAIVQAYSSQEAKEAIEQIFPGCYVTGVFKIKQ